MLIINSAYILQKVLVILGDVYKKRLKTKLMHSFKMLEKSFPVNYKRNGIFLSPN